MKASAASLVGAAGVVGGFAGGVVPAQLPLSSGRSGEIVPSDC